MGGPYQILGRSVQPHILAISTISIVSSGVILSMYGKTKNHVVSVDTMDSRTQENIEIADLEKMLSSLVKE